MAEPFAIYVGIAFNENVDADVAVNNDQLFFNGIEYEDVSDALISFETSRGRNSNDTETCQPGTATVVLDNETGNFSPRNEDGPYFGRIRPMKRLRIMVQQTEFSAFVNVFTGYIDSFVRTFPGGGTDTRVTVNATDYFKILNNRRNTSPNGTPDPQKTSAQRIVAILAGAGVPASLRGINPQGYPSRTVVAKAYDNENSLDACQEMAISDGGLFFVDADGILRFQTYAYRIQNPKSNGTINNGTFGNFSPQDLPVEANIDLTVDDQLLANRIFVTAANGTMPQADDTAAQTRDGLIIFELGQTQLLQVDAESRADEILSRRAVALERAFTLTLDNLTDDQVHARSLSLDLSDRIQIAIRGDTTLQDYYIESVSHAYEAARSFTTTWSLSAVGPLG